MSDVLEESWDAEEHREAPEATSWWSRVAGSRFLPCAVVALPLLMVAWRAWTTRPWIIPFLADLAPTELGVLGALDGEQVLGAYSRYGWYHPGPAYFYALAPLYGLAGRHAGALTVGALVVNAAVAVGIVVLCGRLAGSRGRWMAAAVLTVALIQYGTTGLASPWNPNLTALPTALLVVATAAVVLGDRWALPVVVGAASFVVQTHVGTAVVAGVLSLVAVVAAVRHIRADGVRWWRPGLVAAAVVLTALWALPLGEQLSGDGNLGSVLHYFVTGEVDETSFLFAEDPGEQTLGLGDALGNVAFLGSLTTSDTGRIAGFDLLLSRDAEAPASALPVFVLLVAAAAAGVLRRRTDPAAGALGGAAVAATAAAVLSAVRITGEYNHYVLAFVPGVGIALWLAAVFVVDGLVGARAAAALAERPALGRTLGGTGLFVLVLLVWSASGGMPASLSVEPPEGVPTYGVLVRASVPSDEGPVRLDTGDEPFTGADLSRLAVELEKAGYDVQVGRRWVLTMSTAQDPDSPSAYTVLVVPPETVPPPGFTALGESEGRAFYVGPGRPAE